jgi:CDP-diacylglycerol---serine O-phosphatidyltransferase
MKGFRWRRRNVSGKPRRTAVFAKMRKVPILPTLCTLANGMCGVTAILYMTRIGPGQHLPVEWARYIAGMLLFLAMIFDVFDGYLARRTGQASQFGAELDSLCDAISFGAAPAVFLVQLAGDFDRRLVRDLYYVIGLLYVSCTILRLARFNVTSTLDDKSHRFFQGLPSPAAAGCIASLVVLRYNQTELDWFSPATADLVLAIAAPIVGAAVALLMVSRIGYVHMTNRLLMRRKQFRKVVQVVLLVLLIYMLRELAFGLCFWGYALWGPVRYLWNRWNRLASPPETLQATGPLPPSTNPMPSTN